MNKCPVCGSESTLEQKQKDFNVVYAGNKIPAKLRYYVCSYCEAELDLEFEKDNEIAIKKAADAARCDSVSATLKRLEKTNSFVELERNLALPPKTLSKWKNKSKFPSAAAAALINLLGVFPWLSYIGMVDYNQVDAYNIALVEVLRKAKDCPENLIFAVSNETYNVLAVAHKNRNKIQKDAIDDIYPVKSGYSTIQYKS